MEPEARLDALLLQRQNHSAGVATNDATPADASEEAPNKTLAHEGEQLDSLLRAADQFAVWDGPAPSSSFADQLEAQLLARFAASSDVATPEEIPTIVPPATNDAHTSAPAEPEGTPRITPHPLPWRSGRGRPPVAALLSWQTAAALLLAVISVASVLATAAGFGPLGSPKQTPVSTLSASELEARVRLHLRNADDALTTFNSDVAQRAGDQAYQGALARFSTEVAAASSELATATNAPAYQTLAAQLSALRDRGRHDLRAALPSLTWALRATVTETLGAIGDAIPNLGQTAIAGTAGKDNYVWTLTVHGSGFAPGAVLLIDGQPTGATLSVSATALVAQVSNAQVRAGSHRIGVGNADGTAVNGDTVTFSQPDDHGGRGGSGDGGGSGSSGGSGG
jgi:hypothetical protein